MLETYGRIDSTCRVFPRDGNNNSNSFSEGGNREYYSYIEIQIIREAVFFTELNWGKSRQT